MVVVQTTMGLLSSQLETASEIDASRQTVIINVDMRNILGFFKAGHLTVLRFFNLVLLFNFFDFDVPPTRFSGEIPPHAQRATSKECGLSALFW